MQIAVISDTHRHTYYINKVATMIQDTDMAIHLGDNVDDIKILKKSYKNRIISVRGNCDIISGAPDEIIEDIGGKKLFITHGHMYGVKYDLLRLKFKAEEIGANIVLFGHTHESLVDYRQGIWFVNPGSAALPRDSAPSIAILEMDNGKVDISLRTVR